MFTFVSVLNHYLNRLMNKSFAPIAGFLLTATLSCSQTELAPVADLVSLVSDYSRLDSAASVDTLKAYGPELSALMKVVGCDSVSIDLVREWSSSNVVKMFTPPVDSVFPSLDPMRASLAAILAEAEKKGLELPPRRYAAVVYGRPESILFVDSVALIALNHFLGADFEGYSHWPIYRRSEKTPGQLPYALAEALVATSYPYMADATEATLLSRMVYEGALAKTKLELVPNACLNDVLGYSKKDFEWLKENERDIWNLMVGKRMIFDTSEELADRLIMPSSGVNGFEMPMPARVGRYIGYRIVQEYCKMNTYVTLPTLLSPDFYTSTTVLADSGY